MPRIVVPLNATHLLELFEDNPAAEAIVVKNLDGSIFFSQTQPPVVDGERWAVSPAAYEMQAKFGNLPRIPRWKVMLRVEAAK